MMQSRTHNCGELRLSDAGKSVTIVGWLENVREVGANFAFCVLRDFYGTTQVVIETEEMMKLTKDGKALYLHCLPADITGLSCAEGEVDNSVFDRYIVPLYKQASYKPYIIAAMIFMAQVKDPVKALMELDETKDTRKKF